MKFTDLVHRKESLAPGEGGSTGQAPGAREALENRPVMVPALDSFENKDEWVLKADVPGASPENTKVWYDSREGLSLHVRCEPAKEAKRLIIGEFDTADWYVAFPLPEHLDGSKATSVVANGVLTVHVPKREVVKPHSIPIEFVADKV